MSAFAMIEALRKRGRAPCNASAAHTDCECRRADLLSEALRYSNEDVYAALCGALASMQCQGLVDLSLTPDVLLQKVLDNERFFRCPQPCLCNCHKSVLQVPDPSGHALAPGHLKSEKSGVCWGVLGCMPFTVYAPSMERYVRLCDLLDGWKRAPEEVWKAPAIEAVGADMYRALGAANLPGSPRGSFRFVAAYVDGEPVVHTIVCFQGPAGRNFRIVVAENSPTRWRLFALPSLRAPDGVRQSELVEETMAGGYLSWLISDVLHRTGCIDRPLSQARVGTSLNDAPDAIAKGVAAYVRSLTQVIQASPAAQWLYRASTWLRRHDPAYKLTDPPERDAFVWSGEIYPLTSRKLESLRAELRRQTDTYLHALAAAIVSQLVSVVEPEVARRAATERLVELLREHEPVPDVRPELVQAPARSAAPAPAARQ